MLLDCPDGTRIRLEVGLPPLGPDPADRYGGLVAHAMTERRIALLLVRRGGVAAGIADGTELVEARTTRRHVQGRTAAGGWSQQRFARRREKQTDVLVAAAADLAYEVLVAPRTRLDALALGGDRLLLRDLRTDRRLAPLWTLPVIALPHVPDPRRQALTDALTAARSVTATIDDP